MAKQKQSSSGRKICAVCGQPKSATEYASTAADTCIDCEAAAATAAATAAPEPPPKVEEKVDRTRKLRVTIPDPQAIEAEDDAREVFPVAEIDPTNPTDQELAARIVARRNLLQFIKRFRPKYMAGWVHEDICRRLQRFMEQVERGEEPRLLLMVPVRHGKSEISSRHFPAFVLGHHPDWEIIAASGASSLAMSFSRYLRDLIRDQSYGALYPDTKLDAASQSVENWGTTAGGGYLAAGIGTMITGRGAHILLIDDPVKDAEAADSPTIRDNVWEWYMSTAYTRLAPGGGVLGIMCMTGDTPVMMADGTQRRLDTLAPADAIATYARGALASTTVAAVKSSGRDSIYKITMSSGRIVRANQRHPFLTVAPSGELSWTRVRDLTTALRIVTVKGSGVSGEALRALPRGASSLPSVAGFAKVTMPRSAGQTGIVQVQTATSLVETRDSNTAMASQQQSTTPCTTSKAGAARSAVGQQTQEIRPVTGKTNSLSTTATTQEKYEDCFATTATQESDILLMSQWHLPPLGISDFTLEKVVSVEPDGTEEVFDVQVDDTENFIANGLVSHNTWWNEDDWAGRIQQVMATGDGDKFEIVKYPAINDIGDEYILPDDSIVQLPPGAPVPEGARMTRPRNTALHPERYTLESLLKRKANYYALGQQRWWSALFQQNPTPEEGAYFTKDMFKTYINDPHPNERDVYQAWDFAITEKTQGDYTVGATGYLDVNDNLHITEVQRFRSDDAFVLADTILDMWEKHGSSAIIGVEDGQIWKSIEAVFKRRCEERQLYPAYEVLKPFTDKFVRAQPLRGRMQIGKVWFKLAAWFDDLRNEFLRFGSGGKNDDQVDAVSWLVRLVLMRRAPRVAPEKKMKSWKDNLPALAAGTTNAGHMSA